MPLTHAFLGPHLVPVSCAAVTEHTTGGLETTEMYGVSVLETRVTVEVPAERTPPRALSLPHSCSLVAARSLEEVG